jgi:hypothetical protein
LGACDKPGCARFVDGKEIYYTGGVFTPPSIHRPKHRDGARRFSSDRPQKPLKQLLPFVRNDSFSLGYGVLIFRRDTLRVLYVAAPQVFFWAYISGLDSFY